MSADTVLSKPHLLTDNTGKIVSCSEIEKVELEAFQVLTALDGSLIGKIKCQAPDLMLFRTYFSTENADFSRIREQWSKSTSEILSRDLEGVLYESTQGGVGLDQLLHKCCLYLRTYIQAENISVFGLPDGTSLSGLMAISPHGVKDRTGTWDYASMNIALVAIAEKKPYVCHEPAKDANFMASGTGNSTRNLVSYPILSGGKPIGIINVSNKLAAVDGAGFSDADLRALQKFSTVISHLLREEFESAKGERFQNTSANLGRYLSNNLVRKIAQTGTSGGLGGEMRKTVCLFSDIRSFTTISAGLQPPKLVRLLNVYFEEMSGIIDKFEGTLDKLVGDMMMVLWNIPNEQPEPELLAVRAAIEMQKAVFRKVAPIWRDEGVPNFGVGIGINTGPAVAGNMGSRHFMNYTVIGNTINTAQRLEAKARSGEIWVHEKVMKAVEGQVPQPAQKMPNLALKGLSEGVDAFIFRPTV